MSGDRIVTKIWANFHYFDMGFDKDIPPIYGVEIPETIVIFEEFDNLCDELDLEIDETEE